MQWLIVGAPKAGRKSMNVSVGVFFYEKKHDISPEKNMDRIRAMYHNAVGTSGKTDLSDGISV